MNKPKTNEAPNDAVALLSKLQGYDITKYSEAHYKIHKDIMEIANNATQLLNRIGSTSVLLMHPSVMAAKKYHGEIKRLTDIVVRDAMIYRQELIRIHASYLEQNESRVSKLSEMEIFAYGIQVYQQYETWIENFQQVVLVPFAELSDLLERIGKEFPVEA